MVSMYNRAILRIPAIYFLQPRVKVLSAKKFRNLILLLTAAGMQGGEIYSVPEAAYVLGLSERATYSQLSSFIRSRLFLWITSSRSYRPIAPGDFWTRRGLVSRSRCESSETQARAILRYLNQQSGRSFLSKYPDGRPTKALLRIISCLESGRTIDELTRMVDAAVTHARDGHQSAVLPSNIFH